LEGTVDQTIRAVVEAVIFLFSVASIATFLVVVAQ